MTAARWRRKVGRNEPVGNEYERTHKKLRERCLEGLNMTAARWRRKVGRNEPVGNEYASIRKIIIIERVEH